MTNPTKPEKIKIATFAGSSRTDSTNKKLARLAADMASEFHAESTFIDLRDFPLPVYDGDFESEQGYPDNAQKLKAILSQHNGYIISSPEYNSSVTALLKNTIDWLSRGEGGKTDLTPFNGKVAALLSAAPGNLGGLRGLVHIRSILSNLGMLVIPNQLAISQAFSAFDDQGQLKDEAQAERLRDVVRTLTDMTKRSNVDLHAYCKFLFSELAFDK